MQTIKVRKVDLLAKLKENRAEHRRIFEDALKGWKSQVTLALEQAMEDAKAGRKFRTEIDLPCPEDHTDDYDVVMGQVEWSIDEELTLSYHEFRQFVLDDWGWKPDFVASSTSYSSSSIKSTESKER